MHCVEEKKITNLKNFLRQDPKTYKQNFETSKTAKAQIFSSKMFPF